MFADIVVLEYNWRRRPMRAVRSIFKKTLFTFLVLVLALALLEVVLRIADPQAVRFLRGTRDLFGSLAYPSPLRPGANVLFRNYWRDGEAVEFRVRTDEWGHRSPTSKLDPDRYAPRSPGEQILYCVGGDAPIEFAGFRLTRITPPASDPDVQ